MIKLRNLILEAITYNPYYYSKDNKIILKDTDTIRVYHGFDSVDDAFDVICYGTSGKILPSRRYSYESDNNPFGLFITCVFKVAKQFTNKIIIEFAVKVSDLEAPIWPGGGYTVQGQMSQYWNGSSIKDRLEDREKARLKTRQEVKNSSRKDIDFIKLSDRPELANILFGSGEYQALFMGDLDPNMIRSIWIYEGNSAGRYATFTRMSRKEFLKKYLKKHLKTFKRSQYQRNNPEDKLYKPTEDWKGIKDYINRLEKIRPGASEYIEDHLNSKDNMFDVIVDLLYRSLWPKQLEQAAKELGFEYIGPLLKK